MEPENNFRKEQTGLLGWMNRGGEEQSQKKGCGCLFVGWMLIIGGALGYFAGQSGFVSFSENTFVGIGFAQGVGLCCIIFGHIWVKVRDLIKKFFGRGSSGKTSSSSSSAKKTRQKPTQNSRTWTRTGTQQSSSGSTTGIPNPWNMKQGLYSTPENLSEETQDNNDEC